MARHPAASLTSFKDHSYYRLQNKVILRNAGSIDPENINEYIARGGYVGGQGTRR